MLIFSKVIDCMVRSLFYIGVLAAGLMTLLILVSTLLRYVAGAPIGFADELAGLLFLTLAFTSFPHVLNESGHIRLELLTHKTSAASQRVFSLIAALIFITFAAIFAYHAWQFTALSQVINARSEVSGILLWPWMALLPTSMLLCILVQCKHLTISASNNTHTEVIS